MRTLLLLTTMLWSTAAQSAEVEALDRNRDGAISRVEALGDAKIYKRFATFDADSDGALSPLEYRLAVKNINQRALHDSRITARVKAALLAAKGIPAVQIAVETYEGRVQLKGHVDAPDIVSRAGRVTAAVQGVRTVHNDIAVK